MCSISKHDDLNKSLMEIVLWFEDKADKNIMRPGEKIYHYKKLYASQLLDFEKFYKDIVPNKYQTGFSRMFNEKVFYGFYPTISTRSIIEFIKKISEHTNLSSITLNGSYGLMKMRKNTGLLTASKEDIDFTYQVFVSVDEIRITDTNKKINELVDEFILIFCPTNEYTGGDMEGGKYIIRWLDDDEKDDDCVIM